VVFACKYHVIWCQKDRRLVLVPEVAERLKQMIDAVSEECGAAVIELEVMPDHGHVLVEVDPQWGVPKLVRKIKGRSSRLLRYECRWLSSRLPTLWTNRAGVATGGGAPLAVIEQDIEPQRRVSAHPLVYGRLSDESSWADAFGA
jgi:putative transposase